MEYSNSKIGIIGLGYVGLPLAIEFAKIRDVVGFDKDINRIGELEKNYDKTNEITKRQFQEAKSIVFTSNPEALRDCDIYIITVPTPIDKNNKPDLTALISASILVGDYLSAGNIVIYESTVYPGLTEEICAPILANSSKLKFARKIKPIGTKVFYVGYSPERINPGDRQHRATDIVKLTSGSCPEVAEIVDQLYRSIITAGTYKAESIKIAEAAKVIENTQRDVNIALINELAMLFEKLELDTEAVLEAAGTKWNFLPFRPGLVGGHCIGVDPYYLTYKAQQVGYDPKMILAGRSINDSMASYAADRIIRLMLNNSINVIGARILVLGLTFKENCPDTRNSKVVAMVNMLSDAQAKVEVYDPHVEAQQVPENMQAHFMSEPEQKIYDCIVLAVSHSAFIEMGVEQIRQFGKEKHVLFDLKYAFSSSETDGRL